MSVRPRTLSGSRAIDKPQDMLAAPAPPRRTRLLIADDHGILRAGLRRILETRPDFEVVGEARDGVEAIALAESLAPDLILMDLVMPRLAGAEAIRRITASGRGVRVLVLSHLSSASAVEEVLRAGANGYLLKEAAAEELLRAVDAVRQGSAYFSPTVAGSLGRLIEGGGSNEPSSASLSPREREILAMLAEGHSSREIAAELRLSPRTVDTHRVRMMKKLDLHKASQLVRFAIRTGLIEP